jgi:hypothetical protein
MPSGDSNRGIEQIIEGSIVSYNDTSESDLNKEIEEGLARAERMSKRQQKIRSTLSVALSLVGLLVFVGFIFLWQSASTKAQQQQAHLDILRATATRQQADLDSAYSALKAKDVREKSARATVTALQAELKNTTSSPSEQFATVECWGRDITDGLIGGWLTSYPYCALNDGGGAANAIYQGDVFINLQANQLCLQMKNLHTNSAPANTLAVGFRIALKSKTFSDGAKIKIIETARFTGKPDASNKDFWQCYTLK